MAAYWQKIQHPIWGERRVATLIYKQMFWKAYKQTEVKCWLRKGKTTTGFSSFTASLGCLVDEGWIRAWVSGQDSLEWEKEWEKVRLTLASHSERASPWPSSQKSSCPKCAAPFSYCQNILITLAKGLSWERLYQVLFVQNKMYCGLFLINAADFC